MDERILTYEGSLLVRQMREGAMFWGLEMVRGLERSWGSV